MNTMQLGREMMKHSGDLKDDRQCCDWARIGQILTQLGTPHMPRSLRELKMADRRVVIHAFKTLQSR
jgi:hypothetical protein